MVQFIITRFFNAYQSCPSAQPVINVPIDETNDCFVLSIITAAYIDDQSA